MSDYITSYISNFVSYAMQYIFTRNNHCNYSINYIYSLHIFHFTSLFIHYWAVLYLKHQWIICLHIAYYFSHILQLQFVYLTYFWTSINDIPYLWHCHRDIAIFNCQYFYRDAQFFLVQQTYISDSFPSPSFKLSRIWFNPDNKTHCNQHHIYNIIYISYLTSTV